MDKESEQKRKSQALRRTKERSGIMTSQCTESAEDCESQRKRIRTSEIAGTSQICQDQIRTSKTLKRKMMEEEEGSTPAKCRKEELQEQVPTRESSSSVDILIETSSSIMLQTGESAEDCRPNKRRNSGDEIHRKSIRTSEIAGTSRICQDEIRTRRILKRKLTEGKEEGSTPAKCRKEELQEQVSTRESSSSVDILIEINSSSMMPQCAEAIEDSRPKRRKRVKKENRRKWTRVSKMFGPSKSHQDQKRIVRRLRRKITEEGEGSLTPAKRKNKGLLQQVVTKEPVDISTESSSSNLELCSSGIGDLRKRNLKREDKDIEKPQLRNRRKKTKKTKEEVDSQRAEFQEKYTELHLLGKGGYGSVFAGYREVDKLPVAIKHIRNDMVYKHKDENGRQMALEVAIMMKLQNRTTSSSGRLATVSLLDWYELEEELLIVMERPMPSQDLNVYLDDHEGCLTEEEAKIILKQLVEASIQLQDANIFHRDIKAENVLIERSSEGLRAYLIDFGLSRFDRGRKFTIFQGTHALRSPEYCTQKKYSAGPTTVWQLGVILFEVLHYKNFETNKFLKKKLKISKKLSKNCQDILTRCLMTDPEERPTLQELLNHPWFL
ncbi:serine/threonine-protein kinase 33-like [Gambusia affinis]|uniref:serine/threonine-protein kinase 33-like n=1 Tax=Gambusia affinis TaxID=33528 RepID=UPI001CDCDFB7|nr:serine/threonine-protein kinase 33-like [Gambusia affinis]